MGNSMAQDGRGARHELRFTRLLHPGRGYAFPCDPAGHVNVESLSELARANYLYARTVVGREFFEPVTRAI
jgi:hypothetical protein